MNVLSLFDGMSCGRIALERAAVKVDRYFASEIDKYAMMVSNANYPDIEQLGDITKIDLTILPKIDLLIGGSPCQGFSFSGKQLNFDDPRSKLFFDYVNILKTLKPKYFLLENVKMKKEYESIITEMLGVEPIEINSSLVSAQNRKRLYWTNIPGVVTPVDRNIRWGDVREHNVNKQYYSYNAMNWIKNHSIRKNGKKLKIHRDDDIMQMLEASHMKKYSSQRYFGIIDTPSDIEDKFWRSDKPKFVLYNKDETRLDIEDNSQALTNNLVNIPDKFSIRYITPLECERLQTVPDNYSNYVSDSQRYKMLGNGWTIDVISHIFSNI